MERLPSGDTPYFSSYFRDCTLAGAEQAGLPGWACAGDSNRPSAVALDPLSLLTELE